MTRLDWEVGSVKELEKLVLNLITRVGKLEKENEFLKQRITMLEDELIDLHDVVKVK